MEHSLKMETPVPNKTPKRKLKRITVKNKLSQKKLKTAINVSLNSSHSLRSLRMNNRSLAHHLEGLKREYRGAYDAYQSIQEENHILRQKVVSLECIIHDPDSYIEEQVNKKLEVHVRQVKNGIQQLLDDMCSSHDISTVDRSKRSDSLNGIFSRKLPSLHVSSPLRFQRDINAGHFCAQDTTAHNDEMNMASIDFECNNFNESNNVNTDQVPLCDKSDLEKQENMTMILERSTVFDINSPLKYNEERKTKRVSQEDDHVMKLPRRMVTRSKEKKDTTMEKERTDSILSVRQSWGMTSTLSDDEVNFIGLVDVNPPSNLLLSPQLACSIEDSNEQERDVGDPPNLGNPQVTGCHISEEKKDTQHFKISHPEIHKRVPKVQRKAGLGSAKANDALFISNEFALNNVHQQIAEKLNAMQTEPTKACENITGRDYRDKGEDTVYIEEDMELTMPINVVIGMSHASENHDLNMKEEMSVSSNPQEEPDGEEVCPEAVTLQRMKPGQIKFAASRKETDGSRKILLTQPPRARSKSKKAIAEMIDNLPPEEPKSIFDFHDKTPTLISGKDRDMSVYSLRDESSVMSLPTPLGKRRKSQLPDKEKVEVEGPVNERENSTQSKRVSALGEGISYSIPLKDDSHNNEKRTVGKSISRSRSRTARGRTRSKARSVSNEEPETLNNDIDPCVHSDMISVLDKGLNYYVSPKDDSNNNDKVTVRNSRSRPQSKAKSAVNEDESTNCSKNVAGNEMVTIRKSRSQSRNREERTGSLSRLFTVDSDDVLGNMKESTRCSEKISALGDGLTYSIPLKDDSDNDGKVVSRKSRGRSRSRARASDKNQSDNSQNALDSGMNHDIHHDNTYVLGEGKTYNIPVKNESDNSKKLQVRKSRGRSRTRKKTAVEEHQPSQEETSINSKQISVLGKGLTYSVLLKDDKTDTTETVTVRKSRGRSKSRIKDFSDELSSVNSQEDLHNGKDYNVPLKDDTEAVTISRSRERSRTRTNGGELTYNDRTRSRSQRRRRISPGEPCDPLEQTSITNDELRHQSTSKESAEETNDCERAVSGNAVPSPKKIVLHVSQDLNVQDKNSPSQKTKTGSRGSGKTEHGKDYNVPLKDDTEAVTISRSRERSRTRTNDRTRSRSQRRRRISPGEPCDPLEQTSITNDELRHQSTSKESAEETNDCERAVSGNAVPSPKKIVLHVSQDLNVQDKNSPSQKTKTGSRGSGKTEHGILEDLQKEALNKDIANVNSDENQAKSSKQKCRPKSHKKVHKSKEKIQKREAAKVFHYPTDISLSPLVTENRETLRMEFPPQIITEMVVTLSDISRTCSPKSNVIVDVNATANIKSADRVQPSTSLDISDVPKDLIKTSLKRPSDINKDSVADAVVKMSQGAVGHRNKRKKPKTNVGEKLCSSQEEFESQLNHLKNLCTPSSFKMKTESTKSTSSSSFETRNQSASLSDSLLQTSASGETNLQQSFEPSRRRRAAVKAVNYAEPTLGSKLRQGDPFTTMGSGRMLVYKSPKAQKKIKWERTKLADI